MSGQHSKQTVDEGIHIAHAYEYANAAARTGASGFVVGDIGKLAKQTDTLDWYILTSVAPTWKGISLAVTSHSLGGGEHIADTLANLNTKVSDATLDDVSGTRTPTSHQSSHNSGGADAIKLDDLDTPDDNTDLDATTGRHGLLKKLGGGTINFLRADGSWAAPAGGTPTKHKFFSAGADTANSDGYSVRSAGSTAQSYFTFKVPHDFTSLTSIELIGFSSGSFSVQDIDLNSSYGSIGEDRTTHQESDTTSTYSATVNLLTAIDLAGVLSSLVAGDFVGIHVDHNGIGTTQKYLGIDMRYS